MGRPMTDRATSLRELEEMAANLLAMARKLPPGPDRSKIFQEIGRFRAQIVSLQGASSRTATKGEEETGIPMDGNIFNSQGVHVAIVRGPAIFDLKGKKLYDLRGINIYKLSGELVGHLANAHSADKHLDKATDKLFPSE